MQNRVDTEFLFELSTEQFFVEFENPHQDKEKYINFFKTADGANFILQMLDKLMADANNDNVDQKHQRIYALINFCREHLIVEEWGKQRVSLPCLLAHALVTNDVHSIAWEYLHYQLAEEANQRLYQNVQTSLATTRAIIYEKKQAGSEEVPIIKRARSQLNFVPYMNLRGAVLFNQDLSEQCLYGADLSKANLSNANLSRTNLKRANLSGANLNQAKLFNTNLTDTNLLGASLQAAEIDSANFTNAVLLGTNFNRATVENCKFHQVMVEHQVVNGNIKSKLDRLSNSNNNSIIYAASNPESIEKQQHLLKITSFINPKFFTRAQDDDDKPLHSQSQIAEPTTFLAKSKKLFTRTQYNNEQQNDVVLPESPKGLKKFLTSPEGQIFKNQCRKFLNEILQWGRDHGLKQAYNLMVVNFDPSQNLDHRLQALEASRNWQPILAKYKNEVFLMRCVGGEWKRLPIPGLRPIPGSISDQIFQFEGETIILDNDKIPQVIKEITDNTNIHQDIYQTNYFTFLKNYINYNGNDAERNIIYFPLYKNVLGYLKYINHLLKNDASNETFKLNQVENLFTGLVVCGPGTLDHVVTCAGKLKAFLNPQAELEDIRDELTKACFSSIFNAICKKVNNDVQRNELFPGNEIHYGLAIQNYYGYLLGLKTKSDTLAGVVDPTYFSDINRQFVLSLHQFFKLDIIINLLYSKIPLESLIEKMNKDPVIVNEFWKDLQAKYGKTDNLGNALLVNQDATYAISWKAEYLFAIYFTEYLASHNYLTMTNISTLKYDDKNMHFIPGYSLKMAWLMVQDNKEPFIPYFVENYFKVPLDKQTELRSWVQSNFDETQRDEICQAFCLYLRSTEYQDEKPEEQQKLQADAMQFWLECASPKQINFLIAQFPDDLASILINELDRPKLTACLDCADSITKYLKFLPYLKLCEMENYLRIIPKIAYYETWIKLGGLLQNLCEDEDCVKKYRFIFEAYELRNGISDFATLANIINHFPLNSYREFFQALGEDFLAKKIKNHVVFCQFLSQLKSDEVRKEFLAQINSSILQKVIGDHVLNHSLLAQIPQQLLPDFLKKLDIHNARVDDFKICLRSLETEKIAMLFKHLQEDQYAPNLLQRLTGDDLIDILVKADLSPQVINQFIDWASEAAIREKLLDLPESKLGLKIKAIHKLPGTSQKILLEKIASEFIEIEPNFINNLALQSAVANCLDYLNHAITMGQFDFNKWQELLNVPVLSRNIRRILDDKFFARYLNKDEYQSNREKLHNAPAQKIDSFYRCMDIVKGIPDGKGLLLQHSESMIQIEKILQVCKAHEFNLDDADDLEFLVFNHQAIYERLPKDGCEISNDDFSKIIQEVNKEIKKLNKTKKKNKNTKAQVPSVVNNDVRTLIAAIGDSSLLKTYLGESKLPDYSLFADVNPRFFVQNVPLSPFSYENQINRNARAVWLFTDFAGQESHFENLREKIPSIRTQSDSNAPIILVALRRDSGPSNEKEKLADLTNLACENNLFGPLLTTNDKAGLQKVSELTDEILCNRASRLSNPPRYQDHNPHLTRGQRQRLMEAIEAIIANLKQESRSFFSVGKQKKAELIKAALENLDKNGQHLENLSEILDFKGQAEKSLREAIGVNRLCFKQNKVRSLQTLEQNVIEILGPNASHRANMRAPANDIDANEGLKWVQNMAAFRK